MRIDGRFSKKGDPLIDAVVRLPSCKTRKTVTFYIDKGASHTALNEEDYKRLGVNINKLPKHTEKATGLSGEEETYVLKDVYIVFQTEKDNHVHHIDEMYLNKGKVPSVIGMDFISNLRLILSWEEDLIIITDLKAEEFSFFKQRKGIP